MTTYIMIGSFLLCCVVLMAWKKLGNNSKPQNSALHQRANFSRNQQLTFTRLREVLPVYIILAHVSYDAVMTTKFNRTRHKYRYLTVDFVMLDQQHQILAVVGV